jgi:hypothetical protein
VKGGALKAERADWVRVVGVSVITLLALPLVMTENRKSQGDRPVAAVGAAGGFASGVRENGSEPTATATTTTTDPGFLGASTVTLAAPPDVIDIAVQAPPKATSALGHATFRRWAPGTAPVTNPCATPLAKVGTVVVVTDTDNGQYTSCVNVSRAPLPAGEVVVLDSSVFAHIADLAQAPVPVRLTW